ncbi:MAG: type III-A CRISPR-associated RAMP protein Csm3 [Chloroflexi bacterium]|nr:MAG: type III-A CRISPR-associated RAMP protein Csm3 [Chloroflexota bacterium]
MKLKGKYIISGKIYCKTGLHIGGTAEGFEIGGIDNPVIRDPLTDLPYIPGSSLKGKLRSLLEWKEGKFGKGRKSDGTPTFGPCNCGHCEVCVLFGTPPRHRVKKPEELEEKELKFLTADEEGYTISGPTRLTVRDAFPSEDTKKRWEQWLGEGIYTEIKMENAIDRVTSEANPRPMERVPAGSEFEFQMIVDIYHENDKKLLKSLFTAMALLEDSSLGGSGTRGHGRVEFRDIEVKFRPVEYYITGDGKKEKLVISVKIEGEKRLIVYHTSKGEKKEFLLKEGKRLTTTEGKKEERELIKHLLSEFSKIDWGLECRSTLST